MEDFFFHFYKKLVTSGYLKTGYLIGYLRVEVTRGHQKKKTCFEGRPFFTTPNVKACRAKICRLILGKLF